MWLPWCVKERVRLEKSEVVGPNELSQLMPSTPSAPAISSKLKSMKNSCSPKSTLTDLQIPSQMRRLELLKITNTFSHFSLIC